MSTLVTTTVLAAQAQANYCPRCVQIEKQRAAEGPKPILYYEDQVSAVTTEDQTKTSQSSSMSGNTTTVRPEGNAAATDSSAIKSNSSSNNYQMRQTDRFEQPAKPGSQADYSTVFVILQSKDLLKTLNGPFTLFIPSNEAFRQLPMGTLHTLFRPENKDQLSKLVGNHLVAEKISIDTTKPSRLKTVGGQDLDIKTMNGVTTVNGARVIRSENAGSNGVIYIIDSVLIP